MADYIAVRLAQVLIVLAFLMGVVAFIEDFVL